MLVGEGWTAYLGMLAQIHSVAASPGAGIVVAGASSSRCR